MTAAPGVMANSSFYAYAHPGQRSRFYLALTFALLLFPLVAVGLVVGTALLIVPAIALLVWIGSRVLFARLMGNSILVSKLNYPRIQAIVEELQHTIGFQKPVYVFVYENGSFNSYMRHMFLRRAIFINSELLAQGVSDDEVRWIVGRFIGYLRARKQAGALGRLIRIASRLGVFNLFIYPYERALVYTGDRLALAAMGGEISSAISAMQKLLVGRELGYSVNPEGIVAQQREIKGTFFALLARLLSPFPHLISRYVDLIVFARNAFPAQYARFEAANPGLPQDLPALASSGDRNPRPEADGREPVGRAPHGWVWAGATAAILLLGVGMPAYFLGPFTSNPGFSVPSPATLSPAASGLPPRTHRNAQNQVEPDAGCQWVSDLADDFRVRCTQ